MNLKNAYRKDLENFPFWSLEKSYFDEEIYGKNFLKLDKGESLYSVPKEIVEKLKNIDFNFYPGILNEFQNQVAKKDSVSKENLFFGNGSLDIIESITKLFLEDEDEVITFSPTYPLYFLFTKLQRAKIIDIPKINFKKIDFKTLEKKISDKTKLIFLDNPNNPFGFVHSEEDIIRVLSLGKITIVDEAYFEFCGETFANKIHQFPNLIVLRTFSKMYGLAGVRLGYAISNTEIIKNLIRIRTPHQPNIVAQFLALEIIKSGIIPERIQKTREGQEFLNTNLKQFSFLEILESKGAYIVFRVVSKKFSADDVFNHFLKNKIILKKMDFPYLSGDYLRVNVVPLDTAKKIISVFKQLD